LDKLSIILLVAKIEILLPRTGKWGKVCKPWDYNR